MRNWFWCVVLFWTAGLFPCRGVACIAQASAESSPAGESLEACMRETETASQARKAACAELEQLGVAVDAVLVKNAGVPSTDAAQAAAWFAKFEELRKQLPTVQGSRAGDLAGTVYRHNLDLVRGFDQCAQWASVSASAAGDAALRGFWTAQKAVFQTRAEHYRASAVDALAAQRKFHDLAVAVPQVAEAAATAATQVQSLLTATGGEADVDWKAYHPVADHAAALVARTLSEFVLAARAVTDGRTGGNPSRPTLGLVIAVQGWAQEEKPLPMEQRIAGGWSGRWRGEWNAELPDHRVRRRFVLALTAVASGEHCHRISGSVYGEDGYAATITGEIKLVNPTDAAHAYYQFMFRRQYEGMGEIADEGLLVRSNGNPSAFQGEVTGAWRAGGRSGTWRMWPVQ